MSNIIETDQDSIKNLHILRTSIATKRDLFPIQHFFDTHPKILRWSIDLEDVDKVLKIYGTKTLKEITIINEIKELGFYCESL